MLALLLSFAGSGVGVASASAPLDPYPPVHGGSRVGNPNPQSPGKYRQQ